MHDSSTGKVVGKVKHNGKTFVKEADMQYGTGNMQGVQVVDTMSMAGVDCNCCTCTGFNDKAAMLPHLISFLRLRTR